MVSFKEGTELPQLKVIDFNIACNFNENEADIRGGQGLRSWSAPETRSSLSYTSNSDMWTVGCVLYYLCTGEEPFGEDTPIDASLLCFDKATHQFSQEADVKQLRDLLENLLQKDPAARLTSESASCHPWILKH